MGTLIAVYDNRNTRTNMTTRASPDEDMSWSEKYQLGIYGSEGFGYFCLTLVDEKFSEFCMKPSGSYIYRKYRWKIFIRDLLGEYPDRA